MPGAFLNEDEYLRHLVYDGARQVYTGMGPEGIEPQARARLDHELGVIEDLGFAGFFLVAWDIVSFARDQGSTVRSVVREPTLQCAAVSG